jgi:hypothetical protein
MRVKAPMSRIVPSSSSCVVRNSAGVRVKYPSSNSLASTSAGRSPAFQKTSPSYLIVKQSWSASNGSSIQDVVVVLEQWLLLLLLFVVGATAGGAAAAEAGTRSGPRCSSSSSPSSRRLFLLSPPPPPLSAVPAWGGGARAAAAGSTTLLIVPQQYRKQNVPKGTKWTGCVCLPFVAENG